MLGESSPSYANSENITIDDFYTYTDPINEASPDISKEIIIWTELTRHDQELLNYDEIYKCYGYNVHASHVSWATANGKKRAVITPQRFAASNIPTNIRSIFDICDDEVTKGYINPKLRNQRTFEDELDKCQHFAFAFYAQRHEDGSIKKSIRFLYRENNTMDWILAFAAPIRTELLQSAIIPSFRDPQTQLRLSSWTWFGKLMRHLVGKHDESQELRDALKQVKEVSQVIFKDVQKEIDKSVLNVAFPGTSLSIKLAADNKTSLYKNAVLYIDDGFSAPLLNKGAGIQSATIIGLFKFYTHHVNTSASALLCVEEPELYLHPHARRVVSDRFDEFLENGRHQVILTTHSTEFVRTTRPDINILRIHRDDADTVCQTVTIKELRQLILNPNQVDVLFADKAIICEGFDDYIVRFVADECFRGELDSNNVSVVSVGGKDQFQHCIKLLMRLGIKPYVIADFDFFLRDRADVDRAKYQAKPHDSVCSLGDEFFKLPHICDTAGSSILKRLGEVRAEIKQDEECAFYTAKTTSEIKNTSMAGTLKHLREHGICILDGEIENLFKSDPPNKLTLDRVFDLNRRLVDGASINDIIDSAIIKEFIKYVLAS